MPLLMSSFCYGCYVCLTMVSALHFRRVVFKCFRYWMNKARAFVTSASEFLEVVLILRGSSEELLR